MAKITFITDKLVVDVQNDSKLMDIVDHCSSTLPFGCRMGSCGTCRVIIEDGMKNLNPRTQAEEDLFETFTIVHPNERLACQVTVKGDVKLKS